MKVYVVIGQTSYESSLDVVAAYTNKADAQKRVDKIENAKAAFTLQNAVFAARDYEGVQPKRPACTEEYYSILELKVIPGRKAAPANGGAKL